MLPKFLLGSYKRYKSDTDRFTAWLEETAKACGGIPELSKKSQSSKSRKGDSGDQGTLKYKVPLSKFTALAQIIANSQPSVKIPSLIVGIAQRAISARKRCTTWFRKQVGADSASLSNEGHSHFIAILEQVLVILGVSPAKIESQPAKVSQSFDKEASELKDPANQFSALSLDELDEKNYLEPTGVKKQKPTGTPNDVSYELDEDYEDGLGERIFAAFCLLEDLQRIRDLICQTWSDYRAGKFDLMSASVTTNTAIGLARQSVEDYEKLYPDVTGQSLVQLMYVTACVMRGEDVELRQNPGDPYNMAVADIAEWSYLSTHVLLVSFCDVLEPEVIPSYKRGYYGVYNPSQDRTKMSFQEKFVEDQIVLLQALPDFAFLGQLGIPLAVEDEITTGLRKMMKTKNVPLWLAFAAQVYLDIHHILRVDVQKGFQEVKITALRVQKTLKEYFEFSKALSCPNWPKSNDNGLRGILETIDRYVANDIFIGMKSPDSDPKDDEWFTFLKWHPMQAGLLMFNLNLRMQKAGMALVNAWGSVTCLAYLYNAIEQEEVVSLKWPDMDRIIDFHSEERIFFGRRPKDVNESVKKMCLAMGYAPESFTTKGRRAPKSVVSKKGPRGLEESTTVSQIFRECYCHGGSIDLSIANVSKLLNDISGDAASNKSKAQPRSSTFLQKRWQRTQSLTSLQLLAALRERLVAEEPQLVFNYFGMHRRGIELMRMLRQALHEKFVQYFGPEYIEHEHQLPFVVQYIFIVAMGSGAAARQLGVSAGRPDSGSKITSTLLMRAGDVLKNFLATKGDVGCRELRAFCKNKAAVMADKGGDEAQESRVAYWFGLDEVIDPKVMAALSLGC